MRVDFRVSLVLLYVPGRHFRGLPELGKKQPTKKNEKNLATRVPGTCQKYSSNSSYLSAPNSYPKNTAVIWSMATALRRES